MAKSKKPLKESAMDKYQNRLIKKALSQSKPEIKEYRSQGTVGVDTLGALFDWNTLIVKGTDQQNRIGTKIKVLSIFIKGQIQNATADGTNNMRVMTVGSKAAKLAIGNFPRTNQFESPNSDIMKVYRDKQYFMKNTWDGTTVWPSVRMFTQYVKFPSGHIVNYNVASNDDVNNGLYTFFRSDSAIAPNPTVQYEYTIRFTDV